MITASELERELKTLHGLSQRLMPPLNERPHIFHEQKYALIEFTARLLERIRGVNEPDRSFCTRQVDVGHTAVRHNGRSIPVERRATRVAGDALFRS